MPTLRVEIDSETYDRLVEQAVCERRPIVWQAAILLRRALGLPFPHDPIPREAGEPTHGEASR